MTTATIMNELTMIWNSLVVFGRIAIAYLQHLASQA
jgi:hypothetical protein